jgi:hypothetical protein
LLPKGNEMWKNERLKDLCQEQYPALVRLIYKNILQTF